MQFSLLRKRPKFFLSAGIVIGVAIGALAAFDPLTRVFVAQDSVCLFCHHDSEYNAASKVLWDGFRPITRPHPATKEGGQASCVSCHVQEGLSGSAYVYTHILTFTDFFGRMHVSMSDRQQAPWVTPATRRAYVVRDGFLENDSSPCRTCHIETEIRPKRKRGQKAHIHALKSGETCIACHDNLVHREVPARVEFFENTGP